MIQCLTKGHITDLLHQIWTWTQSFWSSLQPPSPCSPTCPIQSRLSLLTHTQTEHICSLGFTLMACGLLLFPPYHMIPFIQNVQNRQMLRKQVGGRRICLAPPGTRREFSLNSCELPGWIRAFSLFPTTFSGAWFISRNGSSAPIWSDLKKEYCLTTGKTTQKVETTRRLETTQKSTVRWINKMPSIHTMKQDSAIKRNEAPTQATTQINLKTRCWSLPSWSSG